MTPRYHPLREFVIQLRPLPDATDPDGLQRLRRALKLLRRAFGLRCTSATTTTPEADSVDNKQRREVI